jgi:hypothetical protein
MDFYNAIEILRMTKGDLMRLAYGKNYNGIDSAIPQGTFNDMNLNYGAEIPCHNAFYYVTDCRDGYKVAFLPDIISGEIQAAIILKGYYTDLFINKEISVHAIETQYRAIDEILESFEFEYSEDKGRIAI